MTSKSSHVQIFIGNVSTMIVLLSSGFLITPGPVRLTATYAGQYWSQGVDIAPKKTIWGSTGRI